MNAPAYTEGSGINPPTGQVVYLLHFAAPIAPGRHTCQHYLGTAEDLLPRLWAHEHGQGARLTAVAKERGIPFIVARVWPGGRSLERQLQNRHAAPRLCPFCNGRYPVQPGLLPDALPYIPQETTTDETPC